MTPRIFQRFAATAIAMLLLRPPHAFAAGYADPEAIRSAAAAAVRAAAGADARGLVVEPGTLDPRLRLGACEQPLRGQVALDGQLRDHTTVGVHCDGASRWAVYLAVAVYSESPVLVAQRALPAGAVPDAGAFSLVTRRLPGLSSQYIGDVGQLAGQKLRRPVAMGEALDAGALSLAPVVHRGQQLTLLAHASGMDVRVTVVALSDGRPDERIRVQNPSSQRIIEATVRSSQLAEVSL
jgi:flagella basal body P-ring formation protein FlgA